MFCWVYPRSTSPILFKVTSLALGQSYVAIPIKQPWTIWVNKSHESRWNDDITTTKQGTKRLCVHFKRYTVYPKKYAHGFVVLCFVVVMQSFIMNSHEVFIHIHQGCFAGTGAIVRLPQCQWSKPDGYGKISQCITTTKHSKAKTVCLFLGIYCTSQPSYGVIYLSTISHDLTLTRAGYTPDHELVKTLHNLP